MPKAFTEVFCRDDVAVARKREAPQPALVRLRSCGRPASGRLLELEDEVMRRAVTHLFQEVNPK